MKPFQMGTLSPAVRSRFQTERTEMHTHITRRRALLGIASIPVTVAPGKALAAKGSDPSLAALEALIARHTELIAAADLAWQQVPKIPESVVLPDARVQVGRRLLGRDDDGNDVYSPIWAMSDERIEEHYARNRSASLSIYGEAKADEINARFDARIAEKKAELAAIDAEIDRISDEWGLTAAEKAAASASEAIFVLEREIKAFRPQSIAAAARLARWAVQSHDYYLDRDDLIVVLTSIAGLGGAA